MFLHLIIVHPLGPFTIPKGSSFQNSGTTVLQMVIFAFWSAEWDLSRKYWYWDTFPSFFIPVTFGRGGFLKAILHKEKNDWLCNLFPVHVYFEFHPHLLLQPISFVTLEKWIFHPHLNFVKVCGVLRQLHWGSCIVLKFTYGTLKRQPPVHWAKTYVF